MAKYKIRADKRLEKRVKDHNETMKRLGTSKSTRGYHKPGSLKTRPN